MKRKFLGVRENLEESVQEKDDDEEQTGNDGSGDGIGEEKHPPPPKKARFSTEAHEEKSVIGCASKAIPDKGSIPLQNEVKKEPTEETKSAEIKYERNTAQQNDSSSGANKVADNDAGVLSDGYKVKKSSSVESVSSLPTPVLSPRTNEVSTPFYPDTHPVPIPFCAHCSSVKALCIEFPAELLAYFKHASENGAFQSLLELVPNILICVDDSGRFLIVKAFSATAIEKVRMLADAFIENSRLRHKMLRRREDNSKWSFANFESNMFDANFLVEIEVSLAYAGLAFGRNRANLAAARDLHGIREITVDESQKARGICKFKIYANSAEAADNARKMLEFTDRKMPVPSNAVGRLIGKYSRNINDIVGKSGAVRIFIENAKAEEELVRNFVVIGTPETIANAEMMLHFYLWHIRERDDFADERDELERERSSEQSSVADAFSLAGGHRNYDNSAFDHWTSVKAPSVDGCTRANNSNRLPRPIFGRSNRRNCYSGTVSANEGSNGRRDEFPIGTASLPTPSPSPLSYNSAYYRQPLAGTKGQFCGGWTNSAEEELKPFLHRTNCPKPTHNGRWKENSQNYRC